MEDAQTQLVDKLKTATNILVTVSRDPSVDQLSALLGLTLLLNKQGKHASAVFSGAVPSTLEFLKPEETFEKNTDSLRDFIIALDKNKADKLRYKVEDNVVRIFITPYKTSISKDDFEFSQGDFNVELVVAIGVLKQDDLDEAIVAHGRILHDATVASITVGQASELGTINWQVTGASSLSELVAKLAQTLGADLIDEQIATALLTGIVAETERFSNDKTNAETMSLSSTLMAAGANQQLVASKLQSGSDIVNLKDTPAGDDTGSMEISHGKDVPTELPTPTAEELPTFEMPEPSVDSLPSESPFPPQVDQPINTKQTLSPGAKLMTEPPTMTGSLTANALEEQLDPSTDPLSTSPTQPTQMLSHDGTASEPPPEITSQMTPPPPAWVPPTPPAEPVAPPPPPPPLEPEDVDPTGQTLTQIEQAVGSPHTDLANVGAARDEVTKALDSTTDQTGQAPPQSMGSQQLGPELHPSDLSSDPTTPQQAAPPPPAAPDATKTAPPLDPNAPPPAAPDATKTAPPLDPNAPPPVPPPIPFQFGNPPNQQ